MELVKPGTYIDFMRHRKPIVATSVLLCVISLVLLVVPGPNFGVDFRGGTELQLKFKGAVNSGELRTTLERLGHRGSDVVAVQGSANEFIVRLREVSSLPASELKKITDALPRELGETRIVGAVKVSPGGDKLSLTLSDDVAPERLQAALATAGAKVRSVSPFGNPDDHRYEAYLVGVADDVVAKLGEVLGARGPETPRRVEWVGPKAGAQLRDAAIKSLLYAIAMIMVYVAFRFDLRFAPGGAIALMHDALITVGIYVAVQKEFNITTIAALLTIVGYSINDTIVVYDRIRENMARLRDKSLYELINISTSQMLARTVITSGTTLLSISAFFIWGTSAIKDISFALMIGIGIGTYSSIYIAAPITEWMDKRFFQRRKA